MTCNSCEFFNAEHKWCELNDQETHCDSNCKDWAPVCLDPDNPDCSCKACQIAAERLGSADAAGSTASERAKEVASRMKKAAYLIILGLCLMTAGYSMVRQAELEDRLTKLENQVRIGETRVEEMRKTQLTILELFETMFSKD